MKVMLITKVKIGTALLVCAGLLTMLATGSFSSVSFAQDASKPAADNAAAKGENDEDFIRRVSKDLRGVDPSPAEIHFFRASKEATKRQRLVDLFIQERQAKQAAEAHKDAHQLWFRVLSAHSGPEVTFRAFADDRAALRHWVTAARVPQYAALQADFYKQVLAAAKEKKDVATITQNYLDRLMDYVKTNPRADDVADAMLQISLVYRSQGKAVEADAWRDKLKKEHPKSSAAKTAQEASPEAFFWINFFSSLPAAGTREISGRRSSTHCCCTRLMQGLV